MLTSMVEMLSSRRTLLGSLVAMLPGALQAASTRRRSAARPYTVPKLLLAPGADERDRLVAEACERGLGPARGAVVAMDPWTGRVVAIVNPAEAIFRAYQPCSVFKIVVGIAGLSEGVITPASTYNCTKGCWSWPGHGPIDLRRALAVSCNPYFEWVGEQLGYQRVQRYAHLLGLGERSGINLPGETAGVVPARVRPELVGHLSSHAKGIATSAVQLSVLLSACVNGGTVYQPLLAAAAGFTPSVRWRLPETTRMDGMAEGFLGAVNEGSASPAFDPEVVVAGKTGTCASLGWFASYAPAERPEVVVTVFLRHGSGHGASAVAGRIYQGLYRPTPPALATGG